MLQMEACAGTRRYALAAIACLRRVNTVHEEACPKVLEPLIVGNGHGDIVQRHQTTTRPALVQAHIRGEYMERALAVLQHERVR